MTHPSYTETGQCLLAKVVRQTNRQIDTHVQKFELYFVDIMCGYVLSFLDHPVYTCTNRRVRTLC